MEALAQKTSVIADPDDTATHCAETQPARLRSNIRSLPWFRRQLVAVTAALLVMASCAPPSPPTPPGPEPLIVVPAGVFLMGQDDGPASSRPQRSVFLDAFAIERTEVTNEAFARFVQATGYAAKGWEAAVLLEQADLPAVGVTWRDADAYCRWAGLRLPTEAEWEKAARGVDGRIYPWGNTWDPARSNTLESGHGRPRPAGSYPAGASPYGVLDMAGNVAEWVADYFDPGYYTVAPDRNPTGADRVTDHVLRGGSFALPPAYARTFARDSSHSSEPNRRVGFRCARSAP